MAVPHREALQQVIQQDWANREYIEVITVSIKKITDFLNSFDLSCRSKLAVLNEKLTTLERKIDYLEACVTKVMSVLSATTKTINKFANNRQLWQWVNIIFNKVNEDRLKEFGPDRTCSEWLLRNGGAVKFVGSDEFLRDYNALPPENVTFHIKEVDATESSIMHYGFPHFEGCKHIDYVLLDKCFYLQDWALPLLSHLQNTLEFLQVSSCGNITEHGLRELKVLKKLKTLILYDLPYVKDKDAIVKELKADLPNCNITFKTDFNK